MQTYTKSLYETWPSQIEDQSLLEKYDSINSEWRAVAEKVMGLYQQYRSTGNELYLEQAKEIIYNEDTPLQTENWILFWKRAWPRSGPESRTA